MAAFKIILAYDGTDFVGWQRQASGASIQGLIEDALRALDGCDVNVAGAGRTDAGVHALGQVAAFTIARAIDPGTLVRALNAHLPHAIRVLSAEEAPPGFHPRFGARAKTYRYRLWHADV
ncbi:MAG TPA: tRNA pseudouridine synthase A, partial [Vicinamibacterales bacterium]|nr:tRNA pseudouridine synthase A [Vicinamibacterales bacterium]